MLALLLPTTLVALFLPAPQCGVIYLHCALQCFYLSYGGDAFFQLVLRNFGGYGSYVAELYDEALGTGSADFHECAFERAGGDAHLCAACGGELVVGEEERVADA